MFKIIELIVENTSSNSLMETIMRIQEEEVFGDSVLSSSVRELNPTVSKRQN